MTEMDGMIRSERVYKPEEFQENQELVTVESREKQIWKERKWSRMLKSKNL